MYSEETIRGVLDSLTDEQLFSERQRRRALKRTSYTGGEIWKKHNPAVANCRCQRCTDRRAKAKAKKEAQAAKRAAISWTK